MLKKEFTILNETGLHVRPAGALVKLIKGCDCSVKIEYNGQEYDAKSVLGVMGACIKANAQVTFVTDGTDEEKAMSILEEAVANRFGEAK